MRKPGTVTSPHLDVLAIGRIGVDLYPLQSGVGLEDVTTFGKYLGGTAGNVAVAAARYGHRTALLSRVGDDPFGRFVTRSLAEFGVDTDLLAIDPTLATPITFCELFPPDNFPIYFYRMPSAPDLQITTAQVPADTVRNARICWATLTGLSAPASASTHADLWATRQRSAHTIIDLDYRPGFWPDESAATRAAGQALAASSVAIGNTQECRVAVGESDPQRAAAALLERGVDLAIIKQGPLGVLAATATEQVTIAPTPVAVVNGLGAGDAFGGAICHGLLQGWDLHRLVTFASAAGAIVAGHRECAAAMPTQAQVDTLLAGERQ